MIPKFLFPFLPYRSFAFPVLVVSAIAVPCWLVFRLYRRRTPGQRVSVQREFLLVIFVVYLSALAAVTLIPNHNSPLAARAAMGIDLHPSLASLTCSSATHAGGSTAQSFCVRNARGNVMLFFPLGILLPLVWTNLRFWKGLQLALALSCSIELVQYFSSGWSNRSADINDVVLNALGACLGLGLVFLLRLLRASRPTVSPA